MPVVTEFVTLLADFVTHSIGIDGISGLSGIRAGRFEEPGMCSVGSGMVIAIGDLAGATFVTLLAATATQFARGGRLWTLCTIEIEVAVGLRGGEMTLAINGPPAGGSLDPCDSRH